ncbi:lipoate--protein ligase family protein [bacterium]|nr:lipoate--protein ligase family protein [bacterium]
MKFIDYKIYTGKENMKIDSDILESCTKNNTVEPVFRLYGWEPACVSLGRNQDSQFINNELLSKNGIDIVRRLTGGRALLHDMELTYSYVTPASIIPNGENITASYEFISQIWIDIFKEIDINLTIGGLPRYISHNNYCMSLSTGADLCWNSKKFIGSAQCRKNGYILQHGSILIDYNKELIEEIFRENTDFSKIVTLKEIDNSITINDIINLCKNHFRDIIL